MTNNTTKHRVLELVTTGDGSKTIYYPEVGEHYHSKHGALQESLHVFLHSGLVHFLNTKPAIKEVSILEVGLGTGLNFLVTANHCTTHQIGLNYTGIEAYPLHQELIEQTGYEAYVSQEIWQSFLKAYTESFKVSISINQLCSLFTASTKLLAYQSETQYDILYFDAFAAVHQPEMWSAESLAHICQFLKPGGIFVTYAITGELKRTMKALGFSIEKIPGAPGKREMLRATRN